VLAQVLLVSACFIAFGTHEETYLALYAAGVFVLLGLTGWASVKRLVQERRAGRSSWFTVIGTVLAALVTSGAAALIFIERFLEGAWVYLVLVPLVCVGFSYYRRKLGAPSPLEERLGRMVSEQKSFVPIAASAWPRAALAVLDGSQGSEAAALGGAHVARTFSIPWGIAILDGPTDRAEAYRMVLQRALQPEQGVHTCGNLDELSLLANAEGVDLLITARTLPDARSLARTSSKPLLIVHGEAQAGNRYPEFARVIVALDGSVDAEAVLPIVARFMRSGARALLVSVPDGELSEETLRAYADRVAHALKPHGEVEVHVGGSGPARTLVERAKIDPADLVIVASHGWGGRDRSAEVPLGSVPERLFSDLNCSMLMIPVVGTAAAAAEVAA
jgi:nucleotide-binding universal stress UspA family protein